MNEYRTGDYWLIPARTAAADIEWPTEGVKDSQGNLTTSPRARRPQGIIHHYAPLGTFSVADNGAITLIDDRKNETCRKSFAPVTA
jgi:hypothetical protein